MTAIFSNFTPFLLFGCSKSSICFFFCSLDSPQWTINRVRFLLKTMVEKPRSRACGFTSCIKLKGYLLESSFCFVSFCFRSQHYMKIYILPQYRRNLKKKKLTKTIFPLKKYLIILRKTRKYRTEHWSLN